MQAVGELFGQRLKRLLEETDEKQVDLARLLSVTEATISRYLKGRVPDDARTLVMIADHFGVPVDYLLGRTDDPKGAARAADPPPAGPDDELVVVFRGKRQKLTKVQYLLLLLPPEGRPRRLAPDREKAPGPPAAVLGLTL